MIMPLSSTADKTRTMNHTRERGRGNGELLEIDKP
jgi:hypothetical protein